jgi:hypothetical protein
MKDIFSKLKKKDKKRLRRFWRLLEPKDYVEKMIKDYAELDFGEIIKLASKTKLKPVKLKGKLKQQKNGWCYIDVSNDVIHGFFSLIDEEGIEKPPYFDKGGVGAHISAISDEELEGKDIKIKEIGEEINFELGEVFSTKPDGWDEMEKVYFISVDCPELKEIRKKYKLPATYKGKGHDFHITVAIKPKKKK